MSVSSQQVLDWIDRATLAELEPVWKAAVERRNLLDALASSGFDLAKERDAARAEVVAAARADGVLAAPVVPDAPLAIEDFPVWEDPLGRVVRMYLHGDVVSHKGRLYRYDGAGLTGLVPGEVGTGWTDITPVALREINERKGDGEWTPGVAYVAGDLVAYQGKAYMVMEDHVGDELVPPNVAGPGLYLSEDEYLNGKALNGKALDEETSAEESAGMEGDEDTPVPVEGEGSAGSPKPVWQPGTAYEAGDKVVYEGEVYTVLIPHEADEVLTPDLDVNLYKLDK